MSAIYAASTSTRWPAMDREPEQRRDLAPAQPAPNPMGGELFVITEKRYFSGKPLVVQVRREQMTGATSNNV